LERRRLLQTNTIGCLKSVIKIDLCALFQMSYYTYSANNYTNSAIWGTNPENQPLKKASLPDLPFVSVAGARLLFLAFTVTAFGLLSFAISSFSRMSFRLSAFGRCSVIDNHNRAAFRAFVLGMARICGAGVMGVICVFVPALVQTIVFFSTGCACGFPVFDNNDTSCVTVALFGG
jgi:hypothetical protein